MFGAISENEMEFDGWEGEGEGGGWRNFEELFDHYYVILCEAIDD